MKELTFYALAFAGVTTLVGGTTWIVVANVPNNTQIRHQQTLNELKKINRHMGKLIRNTKKTK